MGSTKKPTLADRLHELLFTREDDAIQEVVERGIGLKVERARDAWLKERLSAEDFEEYQRRQYFGPAGEEFPRGWEDAELQEEAAALTAAYRQGVLDGAQLLPMLLGLEQLPQVRRMRD